MILNDPELPKGVYSEFLQFLAAAHISTVNCDIMARDRLRQLSYEIFSIKHKF